QPKTPHPVPLLALPKEWFDPHFALVEGFLIRKGGFVSFRTVKVVGQKRTMDMPTTGAFGTRTLHWTSVTDGSVCAIWHFLRPLQAVRRPQDVSLRTGKLLMDCIIDELR